MKVQDIVFLNDYMKELVAQLNDTYRTVYEIHSKVPVGFYDAYAELDEVISCLNEAKLVLNSAMRHWQKARNVLFGCEVEFGDDKEEES